MKIYSILSITFLSVVAAFSSQLFKDEVGNFLSKRSFIKTLGFQNDPEFEILIPQRVDHFGNRVVRDISDDANKIFYYFTGLGEKFNLTLQKNYNIAASNLKYTARNDDGTISQLDTNDSELCLYHGTSINHEGSTVAVMACAKLTGLIRTSKGDFIIESLPTFLQPKDNIDNVDSEDIYHVIYRKAPISTKTCATRTKDKHLEFDYLTPQSSQGNGAENAVKLTIETAAFIDYDLLNYCKDMYGGADVEAELLRYVLTIMNGIQLLYNDPSLLMIPVHFVLVKVEILKTKSPGFQHTTDSDVYLDKFCAWQHSINEGSDADDNHWDHAFLFSGTDLESDGSKSVIGVAPMNGMCRGSISCTVTEATNFIAVYTGAHEAGHNFGMEHDGQDNACDEHHYIMAPMDEPGQVTWSTCSRDFLKDYLKKKWTSCLLDERKPIQNVNHNGDLPGIRYLVNHQCEMAMGEGAVHYENQPLEEICQSLRCVHNRIIENFHPALQGTTCGINKWCQAGMCKNKE